MNKLFGLIYLLFAFLYALLALMWEGWSSFFALVLLIYSLFVCVHLFKSSSGVISLIKFISFCQLLASALGIAGLIDLNFTMDGESHDAAIYLAVWALAKLMFIRA